MQWDQHLLLALFAVALTGCGSGPPPVPDRGAVPPEALEREGVGRRYALVVGVDRYESREWPQLLRPSQDAKEIASELSTHYGFEILPVPENPTVEQFHEALAQAKEKAGENDDLLVFLAGHGHFDPTSATGYLILRDSPGPAKCPIGGCYPLSQVRTLLETSKARHVLVLVDACHGGTIMESIATRTRSFSSRAMLSEYSRLKSRLILTSGGNERVSDDSEFARQLLRTLRQPDETGLVTFEDMLGAVSKVPSKPKHGAMGRHDAGGTFILMRASRRQPKTGPPAGYVRIEPGTFMMGSPETEEDRDEDEVLHEVTLTRAFWLKSTEVTRKEFRDVMGYDPSSFQEQACDRCPVDSVSWFDAVKYLNRLSELEGLTPCYGKDFSFVGFDCQGYRLPTEAEWEYAARAGTTESWYGLIDEIAWHEGNSNRPQPVGERLPNAWRLYDMLGNLLEWVHDWYEVYEGNGIDPLGPSTGSYRVSRGGSWHTPAKGGRAANRGRSMPGNRFPFLGFRSTRSFPRTSNP